ncbi:hypothetical protein HZC27_04595 [Candidatus Roizmanbacteria bacterium]|nr:hypothetical protein [Candidatus Roizmanbacteria bacterium]
MKKVVKHQKPVSEVINIEEPALAKSNLLPIAVVVVLVGLFLFLKLSKGGGADLNTMKTKTIPDLVKKVVNNPSTKIEVTSAKEVSGLVEFELTVAGQKYTSYVTNDGKLLFTSGIKVDDLNKAQKSAAGAKPATPANLEKADKANVTAFIVANCPYGLQMQRAFKKALSELPDLASSLMVRYIGSVDNGKITSMHGDKEAQENLKQICIREEQKEKYWPYVSCYMQEGKTEECLATAGVNVTDMTSCTTGAGRGLKYAQADFDLANKFSVSSSPTLIANNKQSVSEFDFGGRNANAIKEVVCAASKTKAGYCANALSKDDVAVSLSKTDDSAASNASGNAAPQTAGSNAAQCAPAK